jgi:phage tail sheath protein FI
MAIFSPSESPAIITKEIDLSGVVPNVQSTTGAIVGNFRWGPVNQVTKVSTETELAATFGTPDTTNTGDFHQAAYFLRYSGDLRVIRTVTAAAKNAAFGMDTGDTFTAPTVLNNDSFDAQQGTISTTMTFLGKYPGLLGNSLKVEICPPDSAAFAGWDYRSSFDAAPGTSSYASDRTGTLDEIHLVVIDEDGEFTGVAGSVLEAYPFVSVNTDAKNADGSSNYALDVINSASRYIKMAAWADPMTSGSNRAGSAVSAAAQSNLTSIQEYSLSGGANSGSLTTSQYATGFSFVEDVDTIQVDFLIAPGVASATDQATIVNNMVNIAQQLRKDCIVVTSPPSSDVINSSDPVTDTVAGIANFTRSSYLVVDNNYLKVYDKYNDQYINIPAASSTAGIMAASDNNTAPWFSPAGQRRGNYLGITGLAYTPTKAQRDTLYKAGINPIANLPGQGILLFGDKTHLARPSAFDRINVRRLFLVVERAIALAARNVMFEFNDEFTRAEFVNIVEPFLREIKGRRGITDFRVVCDDSNNTAAVVDRNEFIANIFIKPARSINFVTLNFVAVRTGVDFEEVVGTV